MGNTNCCGKLLHELTSFDELDMEGQRNISPSQIIHSKIADNDPIYDSMSNVQNEIHPRSSTYTIYQNDYLYPTGKHVTLIWTVKSPLLKDKSTTIEIAPGGMVQSLRKKPTDFTSYFGYQLPNSPMEIDYMLKPNAEDDWTNSINLIGKTEGRYFKIEFREPTSTYTIKDLGNGFGTFVQLETKFNIKESSWINVGNSYLVFSYVLPENELSQAFTQKTTYNSEKKDDKTLYLRMYSGTTKYEIMAIQADPSRMYTVGRDEKCDILWNDKLLSRVHCLLRYSDINGWSLLDGNERGVKSTNGTWVFAFDEIEINEGTVFKASSYLFTCHIEYRD